MNQHWSASVITASRTRAGTLIVATLMLIGCSGVSPTVPLSPGAASSPTLSTVGATSNVQASPAATPGATVGPPPAPRMILFDTDVAADDLVALAFLVAAPNVDLIGVTVSGTGEAHCAGGVEVVLRLLDLLDARQVPVACGRETPLAGDHAFPDEWRTHVDAGSGLYLPSSDHGPSSLTAVELIQKLVKDREEVIVLATGPLTNLADAFIADAGLADRLEAVYVMGGALHVPGNLVCCGAPEDNDVAEWNIYVDPRAAQVVVDSGVMPVFVSLDGTNQVPVTREFAELATGTASTPAAKVLADLFTANPFMTDGSYFLWDPLAAQVAAGYPVGSLSPAAIVVEEAEGPESGFTRPTDGAPNIKYLATVDQGIAHATLLDVLNGR